MKAVQRFAVAFVVAILALSVSGTASLLVREPCLAAPDCDEDDVCPPTCATCGCCAQAVEAVALVVPQVPDLVGWHTPSLAPTLPLTTSLDILHVPRPPRG
jgi:hypothetical protein